MASYFELNSTARDRSIYPNPAEFNIPREYVHGWFRTARTVRAHPANQVTKPLEFVTSIDLRNLLTPYDASHTTIPRLFVDFHCQTYNDQYLISQIGGVNRDAKFVLIFDRIQFDDDATPVWIHWKSAHDEQVMRFRRDDPVFFRVFTSDGNTLPITDAALPQPPDPARQIYASFDIRPYIKDDDFDSHLVDTAQ